MSYAGTGPPSPFGFGVTGSWETQLRGFFEIIWIGTESYLVQLILETGAVAQLGERCVRNAEVRSSILLGSTRFSSTEEA